MRNDKMRRLIIFLVLFVAAAALLSCVDQPEKTLELEADKTEVVADGEDHVTFKVIHLQT